MASIGSYIPAQERFITSGHFPSTPVEVANPSWYEQNKHTLYNLFSILVFPIGLVRLSLYLVGRYIVSIPILPTILTPTVLPLINLFGYSFTSDHLKVIEENNRRLQGIIYGETFSYKTKDHISIDAFMVRCRTQDIIPPQEQRWIVIPMPNGALYQNTIQELYDRAEDLGVNILTMNYRGTDHFLSPWPASKEDIIEDVDAGVRFLLSKGVLEKNILMDGLSMGGATAIQVAAKHQNTGNSLSLLAQNTFSTLETEGKVYLQNILLHLSKIRSSVDDDFFLSIPECIFRVIYFSASFLENLLTLRLVDAGSDLLDIIKPLLLDTILTITGFVGILFAFFNCTSFYASIESLNQLLNDCIATKENSLFIKLAHSKRIHRCIASLASLTGWNIDNLSAYKKLQGHRLITYAHTDCVIPWEASLAKAILCDKELCQTSAPAHIQPLSIHSVHCSTLYQEDPLLYASFAQRALGIISQSPTLPLRQQIRQSRY